MDRRTFLRALAEVGFGDADIEWRTAPHTRVEHAWEKLRQSPFLISVSAGGRLASAVSGRGGLADVMPSAPVPRYRLEQIAYYFFSELGEDARDRLGVVLVEPSDAAGWCFAQLSSSIDDANAAAKSADMPLHFERKLSAAEEAWERQVQSGMVVGMDDPVWMAKTQEQLDAHLEWIWHLKKGA